MYFCKYYLNYVFAYSTEFGIRKGYNNCLYLCICNLGKTITSTLHHKKSPYNFCKLVRKDRCTYFWFSIFLWVPSIHWKLGTWLFEISFQNIKINVLKTSANEISSRNIKMDEIPSSTELFQLRIRPLNSYLRLEITSVGD